MGIVRETISFERGGDPKKSMNIGRNSTVAKTLVFNKLEKKGISFRLDWSKDSLEKDLVIENIYILEKLINKLIDAGLKIKFMRITHHNSIIVKTIEVLYSNSVIHHCLTEEDGNFIIDICKKFSISDHENFHLSDGEKYIYIHDENKWLDDIVENRKKIQKSFKYDS